MFNVSVLLVNKSISLRKKKKNKNIAWLRYCTVKQMSHAHVLCYFFMAKSIHSFTNNFVSTIDNYYQFSTEINGNNLACYEYSKCEYEKKHFCVKFIIIQFIFASNQIAPERMSFCRQIFCVAKKKKKP